MKDPRHPLWGAYDIASVCESSQDSHVAERDRPVVRLVHLTVARELHHLEANGAGLRAEVVEWIGHGRAPE